MKLFEISVLFLATAVYCVTSEGYFIIAGPKLVRHQSPYQILVTSYDYDECCPKIQLTIKGGTDEKKTFEQIETVELNNNETKKVTFDLQNQVNGSGFLLEAKTLTGPYYQRSILLDVATQQLFVIIQTDKSTYKPSDDVKFRVLVLDHETKPFKASNVDVFISDSENNRLKQYLNVELDHGVFKNEFKLSDSPYLGTWQINVKVNGEKEEKKEFQVAKYVLPKYELSVSTDPALSFKDDTLKVTVSAKYTYGKSVRGNATITVKNGYYEFVKSANIDGKNTIDFDLQNDLKVSHEESYTQVLEIEVKFVEELTGNEQIGKAKTSVYHNRHEINISVPKETFKAGLPFRFDVHGKNRDGTPLSDNHNPVKITIVPYEKPFQKYCDIEPLNETQLVPLKNGVASVYFNTTKDNEYLEITAEYLKDSSIKNVEKEKSNSDHYIQARIGSEKPSLNENVEVTVEATEDINTLNYQIVARGNIIASEVLSWNAKGKQQSFNFKTTFGMIPQAHLIVSYFRPTGEIIFDQILINFASQLPNHINLELSQSETQPDSKLNITVRTSPKSYVGLLGIDQSALLIGGGNDIQSADVFEKLKQFGNVKEWNTDHFSILYFADDDYLNIGDENFMEQIDFDQSNSFLITNKLLTVETPKKNLEMDDLHSECSHYRVIYYKNLYPGKSVCCKIEEQSTEHKDSLFSTTESHDRIQLSTTNRVLTTFVPQQFETLSALSAAFPLQEQSDAYLLQEEPAAYPLKDEPQAFLAASIVQDYIPDNRIEFSDGFEQVHYKTTTPKFEIRKSFPETWFFDDFEMNESDNGTRTLTKTVPSAITSWLITGFSINPTIGFGLTQQATNLKVFQPFFVSTNLPYSIKRGEVVAIPITVFNYLEYDLYVDVTLHNEHGEFEFIEIDDRDNNLHRDKTMNATRMKRTIVKSDDGASMSFMIKPLKVGYITIKAIATSAIAGDGVERQLLVEPEGVTKYTNKVILIDLKDASIDNLTQKARIIIPPSAVPDSTKIEVGVVGDVMGPSISNLEKLIKLPYGCGEQNMLNFVPNIVVLNYLTTINKLTPETKQRLIKYLESGYQRELIYKHGDGSYSAFGRSDSSGSTWLTAFVAKSFSQAEKFIIIDASVIKGALEFLQNIQNDNGQFPEVGTVIHKDMQGGSSNGIALTAYVLIAFLENDKYRDDFQHTTEKAVKYIAENIDSIVNDSYSLAIAAYAMQLANHTDKTKVLDKLNSIAERKSGEMYWSKEKASEIVIVDDYWSIPEPKSLDVEMTAYAMQANIKAERIPEAFRIMTWLLKQRNENGGYQSTQDTVVGLQALASLAQKFNVPNVSLDIVITETDANSDEKVFHIRPENTLLLQKEKFSANARNFLIKANGNGFGLLQIAYKYNVNETGDQPLFVLEPKVQKTSSGEFLHLIVCASFAPPVNGSNNSNMAVMEVAFPSGFTLDPEHLTELENSPGVKKVETQKQETIVIIYFDSLNEDGRCPELKAYRTSKVANQKPAAVVVYDYYDNSYRVTEFYNPPEITLCDICEGDECKSACEEEDIVTEQPSD